MDLETAALLTVVGVLALNQLVMRVGTLYRHAVVFYALILIDLMVGTMILLFGLPGFGRFAPVSWVLGLLFFLHSSQNLSLRRRRLQAARRSEDASQSEAFAALAARLDAEARGGSGARDATRPDRATVRDPASPPDGPRSG